ncbi:MAG: precorrin-8X methylmutase [Deltaproteobacteria bacterium]|nr:precorrin-8X methylmutase [Deltaproteobacteria bacterium]
MQHLTSHNSRLTAVLILGHGSPVSNANNTLLDIARAVKIKGGYDIVQPAFLQFEHPNFAKAVDILAEQGVQKIIVHPYFLYMGSHVTKDLPFEIETAKKKYPNLEIPLVPHLGYHEKLVDVAVERIESARQGAWGQGVKGSRESKSSNPRTLESSNPIFQHPIEAESFRLIGEQLDESRFNSLELPIVKRLIHTTADFEYADLVRFGNNAIEAGMDAISKGADIITDVRMVEVGISKEKLNKFGGKVRCFVSDEDVVQYAKSAGITKTAAAMRKAIDFTSHIPHPTCHIVAVGNAPTALLELIKMIKAGQVAPALVIGVPVGFVDAEESKEELMKLDIPYISIKGKKGGSTVAVAIVNALLMMAEMSRISGLED